MSGGIVEELFIANNPATGLPGVWFRNWSVTAEILPRSAFSAAPKSVKWSPNKNRFVVQIGTTPANFQYLIYDMPRDVEHIFGSGVIPSTSLARTESPATLSALTVISVTRSVTRATSANAVQGTTNENIIDVDPGVSVSCVMSITSFTKDVLHPETLDDTASDNYAKTLADILASASAVVEDFALDTTGNFLLFASDKIPDAASVISGFRTQTYVRLASCKPEGGLGSSADTSAFSAAVTTMISAIAPRANERHAWLARLNGVALREIRWATALSALPLSEVGGLSALNPLANPVHWKHINLTGDAACVGSPADKGSFCLAIGLSTSPTFATQADPVIVGTTSVADSAWRSFAFVSANAKTFSLGAVSTVSTPFEIGFITGVNPPRGNLVYVQSIQASTVDPFNTYSLHHAYILKAETPVLFLIVVKQTHTVNPTKYGLFLMNDNGATYKVIQDFTQVTNMAVITANQHHVIWYTTTAGVDTFQLTALNLHLNGVTAPIGATTALEHNQRYRLLDGDILFDGLDPGSGFFISAWTADGYPTLSEGISGFPPQTGGQGTLGLLAVIPNGVSSPALPDG